MTPEPHWKGRQLLDVEKPYTSGELAELFNVNPKTITRWADGHRLVSFRTLGGHRRFPVEGVIELFRKLGLDFPKDANR